MPRLRKIGRPSPALVVAIIALVVALGGTAWAAATVVNIADPTTPANVAHVDATGALKTSVSGSVSEAAPRLPWFGKLFLFTGAPNPVITANKATVALTRILMDNYYGQTNGATVQIQLEQVGGNDTTCDGSSGSRTVGTYDVHAGSTFADSMETPIVLKPFTTGTVWCLQAFLTVQGSPGSYFLPSLATSGYVPSGTLPTGAVATSKPSDSPTPPQSAR